MDEVGRGEVGRAWLLLSSWAHEGRKTLMGRLRLARHAVALPTRCGDSVSDSLLAIVVAWATFLFCGFGLMSSRNAMAFAALAVGAAAVASAVYLIMNLSDPYSGLFEASRAPIERILENIGNP
jgi:hypothetical protein